MTNKFEIHGHDVEFEKNQGKSIIEIQLEDDPRQAYLLDIFSVDEQDYIALIDSESEELYLFKYDVVDDEQITLNSIESEEKLDEIAHIFSHYWDDESIETIVDEYISDIENSDIDE